MRNLWIPNALRPLIDAVALEFKAAMGYFTNSHTTVIRILDMASNVLIGLAKTGDDAHHNQSIVCRYQAVLLSAEVDEQLPARLYGLGRSLLLRADKQNAVLDIDHAIDCLTQALQLYQIPDESQMFMLQMLGVAYVAWFRKCRETHDIDSAIKHQKQAVSLIGDMQTANHQTIFDLGHFYNLRFEQSETLGDLNQAV